MKVTEDYVRWVRDQCGLRGWDKATFARRTGLNASQTGRIVDHKVRFITDETAEKIAAAFGVSMAAQHEIASGRAAQLIKEHGDAVYLVPPDRAASLAVWLRSQPAQLQDLIFSTAKLHGFEAPAATTHVASPPPPATRPIPRSRRWLRPEDAEELIKADPTMSEASKRRLRLAASGAEEVQEQLVPKTAPVVPREPLAQTSTATTINATDQFYIAPGRESELPPDSRQPSKKKAAV